MKRRPVVTALLGLVALALLAGWFAGPSAAQEGATATSQPTPSPTAYPLQGLRFTLLAEAEIAAIAGGATIVRAASLALAPGQVALPFTNEAPTILAVQSGTIRIRSDGALVRVIDVSALIGLVPIEGTPGPLDDIEIGPGRQINLPAGATTTIGNTGTAPASVLILTIVPPDPAAATPTP